MTRLTHGHQSRISHDAATGAIRSWYNLHFRPDSKSGDTALSIAQSTLQDSADLFKWKAGLSDIADRGVIQGPGTMSVRFGQTFKGLRVDSSDIVVNLDDAGHLTSVYNAYHYDIPTSLNPKSAKITEADALRIAHSVFNGRAAGEPRREELIVYQYQHVPNTTGKPGLESPRRLGLLAEVAGRRAAAAEKGFTPQPGQYYLAWDIHLDTKSPKGAWRILIDAANGHILNLIDLAQYLTGSAQVFDPNPIVTSGDTSLRHTSPSATINAQRLNVSIDNLNPPSGGNYELHGSFVHMAAEETPAVAEPTSTTGAFDYVWDDNNFLDAMAYFHLNRFQEYIQTSLSVNNAANYSIAVDPQGLDGVDNSHYVPGGSGTGYIAFGGGLQPIPSSNPIPDAADAMVVLHEYGHAIQDNSNPNFDNPASGVGEGWGDTLAAIFYDDKHANPAATRGFMMSWDSEMGSGSWPGRRYDVNWLFDGPEYANALATDNHTAGQLWCATMFELYRKLGGDSVYSANKAAGRDLALRLHLQANFNVPTSGCTAAQMGQQIEAADSNLGGWRYANGLHKKVVYDTFRRRHMDGYSALPVDVYINDGRQGGYGSLSGNDLFSERLWLDGWWETQDIWAKVAPYPDAASQQAGDPGDHQEPPVGSTAYLYVRVGNRGTNAAGSGSVTVKAFHADPGIGLTWPEDWTAMDTPSVTVPNILPGVANHVVVGPFPWTPTVVGHECVLAVVECANDHAVTQDLLSTDHVYDGDMVPFDNNIAQRNLAPTPAKAGGKYRFVVKNPFEGQRTLNLATQSTLPEGWRFTLSDERLVLGPRERRWVEIAIDQAGGAEVVDFTTRQAVQVTGLVDGRAIGGMSFYLAPPSAFPGGGRLTHPGRHHERRELEDLLSLDIPWRECSFEGEIELRLRFHRK
jgi:hypothetical protein